MLSHKGAPENSATAMEVMKPPHVDVEGLWFVDFEASGPRALHVVHDAHAQQLVVVAAGPVEDHAGARQGGDVALRVGGGLDTRGGSVVRSKPAVVQHKCTHTSQGVQLKGATSNFDFPRQRVSY